MKLLTVQEVAGMLCLSRSKVYEMCSNGELPSLKVSGSIRFLESDLIAFIESCRREKRERKQSRPRIPQLKHLRLK